MSELYEENLTTLVDVMHSLEDITKINGVFEVEIRVRVDDVNSWAVIGWGESGDPCVLRFEEVRKPAAVIQWPNTINTGNTILGTLG